MNGGVAGYKIFQCNQKYLFLLLAGYRKSFHESTPPLRCGRNFPPQHYPNQLELLAQQLFPGGVLVESEKGSFDKKVATTKKLIRSNAKTIYGASFKFKNILIMVSILNKTRKGWDDLAQ